MAKLTKEKLVGQKFGYLTIADYLGRDSNGSYKVIAKCECGVEKEYFLCNLRKKGHTTSCGCKKGVNTKLANTTHGISIKHPLHRIWSAIKRRCNNENDKKYHNYGGRGVRVCDEWSKDFKAFYDWAMSNGWELGMQIDKDKKAKELGVPPLMYSPLLCSIITCKENQNNREDNIIVEYKGETMTLSQLADRINMKYHLLWSRYVQLKWDIDRAVTAPPKK